MASSPDDGMHRSLYAVPDPTDKITAALARAQGEFPTIARGKVAKVETRTGADYSYSYADLASVLAAVRPVLAKHGIAYPQNITTEPGAVSVTTTLWCEGQSLTFGPLRLPVPDGATPQQYGSAATYAKRYALCAVLGIASEDEDDDAAALHTREAGGVADKSGKASEPQMKRMHALAKQKGKTHADLQHWAGLNLGVESLTELTKRGAKALMDALDALPDVEGGGTTEASTPQADPAAESGPVQPAQDAGPPPPTTEPGDDEPASDALWAEAVELAGDRAALMEWYRDVHQITKKSVPKKEVTTAKLREAMEVIRLGAAAAAALPSPEPEGDAREEAVEGDHTIREDPEGVVPEHSDTALN